jgi:hypothetical protein
MSDQRTILCLQCGYERSLEHGELHCPECHSLLVAPDRELTRWCGIIVGFARIQIISATLLVPSIVLPIFVLRSGSSVTGLLMLSLLCINGILAIIGLFIAGGVYDRRMLLRNRTVRTHFWVSSSITLLCFAIPIVMLIVAMFL